MKSSILLLSLLSTPAIASSIHLCDSGHELYDSGTVIVDNKHFGYTSGLVTVNKQNLFAVSKVADDFTKYWLWRDNTDGWYYIAVWPDGLSQLYHRTETNPKGIPQGTSFTCIKLQQNKIG